MRKNGERDMRNDKSRNGLIHLSNIYGFIDLGASPENDDLFGVLFFGFALRFFVDLLMM